MTSSLSYPLTKFRYFTQLLTTTPICVVSEIANSCGYRVDGEKLLIPSFLAKVTQLCYNAAVVEYPHDVTEENGSAIAIFINNDFPWPIEDLQLAYDFVRRGTDIDFKAYAAGYPTPSHPERILPSICYAAMLERKFTTTQHMSLLEMYNILTTSMIDKQQYILSHLNALTEEGLNMMYGYSLQASTIITYNPEDVYKHSAAKSLPTMSYDAATAVPMLSILVRVWIHRMNSWLCYWAPFRGQNVCRRYGVGRKVSSMSHASLIRCLRLKSTKVNRIGYVGYRINITLSMIMILMPTTICVSNSIFGRFIYHWYHH
jgi:hypothetical protein